MEEESKVISLGAVVDTNIYIHALIEDSTNYRRARRLLDTLSKVYMPIIVLYEIIWVLRKLGLGNEKIREAIQSIIDNPRTNIVSDSGEHSLKAIQLLIAERLDTVNFNDKVILATALELKLPIATYDGELKREARAKGLTVI